MKAVNQSIGNEAIFMTDMNKKKKTLTAMIHSEGGRQNNSHIFDFICPKEELSVTVATIPPWSCVTDVTLDLRRSPNSPRGSKIAPARTRLLAPLLLLCGRWEATARTKSTIRPLQSPLFSCRLSVLSFPVLPGEEAEAAVVSKEETRRMD